MRPEHHVLLMNEIPSLLHTSLAAERQLEKEAGDTEPTSHLMKSPLPHAKAPSEPKVPDHTKLTMPKKAISAAAGRLGKGFFSAISTAAKRYRAAPAGAKWTSIKRNVPAIARRYPLETAGAVGAGTYLLGRKQKRQRDIVAL